MANNTFKLEFEDGVTKSVSVEIKKANFIKGWWSYDKEGNEEYVFGDKKISIPLEETMYFQLKTEGIVNGQEITFKLWEQDKNILMTDWLDPDDNKFPEEEIIKKGTVKNNRITIELLLQSTWESMIKDDSDNAFSLDTNLELYWEISYGNLKKELPNNDTDYLRVGYPERTLYFKTPTPSHNLPELISYDGDPLFIMKLAEDLTIGKIKDKGIKFATNYIDVKISNIALTKLKKGFLVDNNGKIYTGKRLVYEYKKMYTNSGEVFEDVVKGKNFGYNHGNGLVTTKGVSQYDFFTKNGKRVKLLGFIKSISGVFDIFDLFKFATDESDTSIPSGMFGPMAPLVDLLGVLVQEQKAEMDMWMEEVVQEEIDLAKLQGLEATRKAINSWNHNEEYNWQLLEISKETANKLVAGKFKTFDELIDFDNEVDDFNQSISILYRTVKNTNRDVFVDIIETLFINE